MNPQVQTEKNYDWSGLVRDVRGTCDSVIPPEHHMPSYMSCGWNMPATQDPWPAPAGAGAGAPADLTSLSQLDVVDFASLSLLAYMCAEDASIVLNRWFPEADWQQIYHTADNASATVFQDYYSAKLNASIVAVRGTYSFWDVLSDINLFYEVAAIQLSSTVLPITGLLPDSIIESIIKGVNTEALNDRYATAAYGHLESYVVDAKSGTNHTKLQRIPGPRTVILTGHSLGGAVADIVASKYGFKAVAFSSPGIYWSRRKFGITSVSHIDSQVLSVVPERDFVPSVDKQRGLVQYISCPHNSSSLGCHSIIHHLCNLASACNQYGVKPIFEPFPEFQSRCSQ